MNGPEELFVYGTLGPADEGAAARDGWIADAVPGEVWDLGPYPALVGWDRLGASWALGHRRPVAQDVLVEVLDPYEGPDYRRVALVAQSGTRVWAYVWPGPLPEGARGPLTRWTGPRVAFPELEADQGP